MTTWIIITECTVYETYHIEGDTGLEARRKFERGEADPVQSEVESAEIVHIDRMS